MKKFEPLVVLVILVVALSAFYQYFSLPPVDPQTDSTITVAAAGDIARLGGSQAKTAELIRSLNPDRVLTLGDNVYERGSVIEFYTYYHSTWGAFKSKTAPSPGNHEYYTKDASGYFRYFGSLAGERGKGYYSFDLDSWHIISLNSERVDQVQLDWLRRDLDRSIKPCILAYWHKPLFSSSLHGNDHTVRPFWDLLYKKGADIVLNGHDHNYERFAKQDPQGRADNRGIREFIVGTGGAPGRGLARTIRPNSEITATGEYGVLLLTLGDGDYDAVFEPAGGSSFSDRVDDQRCNP